MESDGFALPSNRKQRKANKRNHALRERTLDEQVAAQRQLMTSSRYLSSVTDWFRAAWDEAIAKEGEQPFDLVCLGLGSPSNSSKAVRQLVLLDHLREHVLDSRARCLFYDPVTSDADREHLSRHTYDVIDKAHPLAFDRRTFLYMPHCPRTLFEQLVERNWSADQLPKLWILGNSLDAYEDPAHPSATSDAKSPFVSRSVKAGVWRREPMPTHDDFFDTFNDMAWQYVPRSRIQPSLFHSGEVSHDDAQEMDEITHALDQTSISIFSATESKPVQ